MERGVRKRILNNYPQKLLSLLIAAGVWWYVYAAHNPRFQTEVSVPVKYENAPLGFALEKAPKEVVLRLSGDPGMIAAVTPGKLAAKVNLEGLAAGRYTLKVEAENHTPALLSRRPSAVKVELKKLARAKKTVQVGYFGSLKTGLALGNEQYEPREVDVYGAARDVAKVRYARANIDLSSRSESFVEEARLTPIGPEGIRVEDVTVNPDRVRVEVSIRNEGNKVTPVTLTFNEEAGRPPAGLRKEIYPSAISLVGGESALALYDSVETEPFDWRRCREGGIFPITLRIPPGVTSSAQSISLSCSIARAGERTMTVSIAAANLGKGLAAEMSPASLKVVLRGSEQALKKIAPKDIEATVDLLGLDAGTHLVAPSAAVREGVEGVEATTDVNEVEVKIKQK